MSDYKKYFVGGALNIAAGLGTAGFSALEEQRLKRQLAQAQEEAAGPIRSQAARQRVARMEGDAQSALDAALRAEATAASQLAEAGGARTLMAASPQLQRATELGTAQALQQFGDYGAQVSAAQEQADLAAVNQRLGGDLSRLQQSIDIARAGKVGGLTQAGMGVAQVLGGLPKKEGRGPDVEAFKPSLETKKMGPLDAAMNMVSSLSPRRQSTIPSVVQYSTTEDMFNQPLGKFNEGGKVEIEISTEDDVEETPGEFNHDTNPIDIIQDGEKIGEMTGGEYIFNPEQAETLRELSMQGDSPLHQFIRELLSKEEFNEEEDND